MKVRNIKGIDYKLPNLLSPFQEEMYVHLINWKWENISKEVGYYKYKGIDIEYDAILPENVRNSFPILYPTIINDIESHLNKFSFKFHEHFNHMVSSQAANINLFLPILLSTNANDILSQLKHDFKKLAIDELYKGFRIEFWDGNSNKDKGLLGDHSAVAGTDSDIGIAYYNHQDELCLWLIEHKLTESEFTDCGGFSSKARDKSKHLCENSFSEILLDKESCFHHSLRKREYWNLTETNQSFFINHSKHKSCPFQGGMNQLWRNQLLGFALEKTGKFKEVYFSVVKHPDNKALDNSINQYKDLINYNKKFSVFDSKEIINVVITIDNPDLNKWIEWYEELYKI